MVVVNTIGLPKESPFRKADQLPLPKDPIVGA